MNEEVLNKAIKKYGETHQILVAVEEMQELSKELLKYANRGADNREAIIEELADCYITLQQIRIIFDFNGIFTNEAIYNKLKRLEKRMNEEKK